MNISRRSMTGRKAQSIAPPLFKRNRDEGGGCDHLRPSRQRGMLLGASLLAVLILACTLCIGMAGAQDSDGAVGDTFSDGTLNYTIVSENPYEVCVKSACDNKTTSITIPNTVEHNGQSYTITSIGRFAFLSYVNLSSVSFNTESLSTIDESAFHNCKKLTTIQIPDTVTSIGLGAFRYTGLTSVTIPSGVTQIAVSTFEECPNLSSVTFKGQVVSIGNRAFIKCTSLTEIQIPDTVTSIGEFAFYKLGWTSVTIPSGVTQIDQYTFSECPNLSSVTFKGQVASIGSWAFSECTSLTEIQFLDTVASIGWKAFDGCGSLQSIRFGKGIETIDGTAFNQTFYDETGTKAFDVTTDVSELQGRLFKADKTDKTKMIRQVPYTLTFDCGDGITMKYEYNEGDRIAKPDDPEKTGYSFMYWANDGKEFDFATETMPAKDITLTAVWKADTFTVTFVTGTGTVIAEEHVYGEAITLPGEGGDISKTGYSLSGWQISGEGDVYRPGTEYIVMSDVTFTAVWEAVPSPAPTPTPSWDDDDDPCPVPASDDKGKNRQTESGTSVVAVAIAAGCAAALLVMLAMLGNGRSRN